MRAVQWRARPNAAHSLHRRRRPGDALIADRVQHLAAEIAFVRIVSVDDGEIPPARAVRAHAEQREILDHLAPHRGGAGNHHASARKRRARATPKECILRRESRMDRLRRGFLLRRLWRVPNLRQEFGRVVGEPLMQRLVHARDSLDRLRGGHRASHRGDGWQRIASTVVLHRTSSAGRQGRDAGRRAPSAIAALTASRSMRARELKGIATARAVSQHRDHLTIGVCAEVTKPARRKRLVERHMRSAHVPSHLPQVAATRHIRLGARRGGGRDATPALALHEQRRAASDGAGQRPGGVEGGTKLKRFSIRACSLSCVGALCVNGCALAGNKLGEIAVLQAVATLVCNGDGERHAAARGCSTGIRRGMDALNYTHARAGGCVSV
mmetsp:Transcript_9962/g.41249  ORF Transcript_9962/g.41249 Transcript_9962/m.41249 type:complete len:383 (-) Transcript_9962:762-1910(-)